MSNEKPNGNEPIEEFSIALDADPPTVVYLSIPVKKYAEDIVNGEAMVHGKLWEAEVRIRKMMQILRTPKLKQGVIMPDGKPAIIN